MKYKVDQVWRTNNGSIGIVREVAEDCTFSFEVIYSADATDLKTWRYHSNGKWAGFRSELNLKTFIAGPKPTVKAKSKPKPKPKPKPMVPKGITTGDLKAGRVYKRGSGSAAEYYMCGDNPKHYEGLQLTQIFGADIFDEMGCTWIDLEAKDGFTLYADCPKEAFYKLQHEGLI